MSADTASLYVVGAGLGNSGYSKYSTELLFDPKNRLIIFDRTVVDGVSLTNVVLVESISLDDSNRSINAACFLDCNLFVDHDENQDLLVRYHLCHGVLEVTWDFTVGVSAVAGMSSSCCSTGNGTVATAIVPNSSWPGASNNNGTSPRGGNPNPPPHPAPGPSPPPSDSHYHTSSSTLSQHVATGGVLALSLLLLLLLALVLG